MCRSVGRVAPRAHDRPTTVPTTSKPTVLGVMRMGLCSGLLLAGWSSTVFGPVRQKRLTTTSSGVHRLNALSALWWRCPSDRGGMSVRAEPGPDRSRRAGIADLDGAVVSELLLNALLGCERVIAVLRNSIRGAAV